MDASGGWRTPRVRRRSGGAGATLSTPGATLSRALSSRPRRVRMARYGNLRRREHGRFNRFSLFDDTDTEHKRRARAPQPYAGAVEGTPAPKPNNKSWGCGRNKVSNNAIK